MNERPSVLLCDYGGVLTTSLLGAAEQICAEHGVAHDGFRAAMRALRSVDDPVARVERGEIDTATFELQLAAQVSRASRGAIAGDVFLRRMVEIIVAEPRMLAALDELRAAGIRTALISNSWSDDYPDDVLARCDHVFISGRLRMRKPDPQIYLHAISELDVGPQECCFLDDFKVNVATAQRLGMHAILHTSVEATLPALAELFDVQLSTPAVT